MLVLCAVFVPVAFLGGLAGELYRQFAVTIAIAVVISGIVALTLTPALCALLLKHAARRAGAPFALVQPRLRLASRTRYTGGVGFLLSRHGVVGAACSSPSWSARRCCLFQRMPGSLVPDEDQGYLHRDGAAARRRDARAHAQGGRARSTAARSEEPGDRRTSSPSPASTSSAAASEDNAATIFVTLKHWDERTDPPDARSWSRELFAQTDASFKDGLVLALQPAGDLRASAPPAASSSTSRTAATAARRRCREVTQQFLAAAAQATRARAACRRFWRADVPQLYVDVDREKAQDARRADQRRLRHAAEHARHLLRERLQQYGRTWQVLMSAEPTYREQPDDIAQRLRALATPAR